MSKDLKKRGFRFVGSTICYAFMQATGMVNDHLVTCFRYRESRFEGEVMKCGRIKKLPSAVGFIFHPFAFRILRGPAPDPRSSGVCQ